MEQKNAELDKPVMPTPKTTYACSECKNEFPEENIFLVNDQPFCTNCHNQLTEKIKTQEATGSDMITGALGACVGAIIAGILWGLIVILTNYEIGYVAIGVGILAGYGVYFASGRKRGAILQIIASAASILGILIGKYVIFYHFFTRALMKDGVDAGIVNEYSLFSFNMLTVFFDNIGNMVGGFDILWIILAVGAAYKIPKMIKLEIKRPSTPATTIPEK